MVATPPAAPRSRSQPQARRHHPGAGPDEPVARRLSLCWGVIPVVLAERTTAEGALRSGIESATSRGLVEPGQHAVLLADQIDGRPNVRAVLAGTVG